MGSEFNHMVFSIEDGKVYITTSSDTAAQLTENSTLVRKLAPNAAAMYNKAPSKTSTVPANDVEAVTAVKFKGGEVAKDHNLTGPKSTHIVQDQGEKDVNTIS